MLQYRRRNTKDRLEISHLDYTHPLLTYCNWSFDKAYHINLTALDATSEVVAFDHFIHDYRVL
jgi:hypothetical protein